MNIEGERKVYEYDATEEGLEFANKARELYKIFRNIWKQIDLPQTICPLDNKQCRIHNPYVKPMLGTREKPYRCRYGEFYEKCKGSDMYEETI